MNIKEHSSKVWCGLALFRYCKVERERKGSAQKENTMMNSGRGGSASEKKRNYFHLKK